MIISDTEATKEKVKPAPVKKGTDLFIFGHIFVMLMMLTDASLIYRA